MTDPVGPLRQEIPTEWGVVSERDGEVVVRCDTKGEAVEEQRRLKGEQTAYRAETPVNIDQEHNPGMDDNGVTTYKVERVPAIVAD